MVQSFSFNVDTVLTLLCQHHFSTAVGVCQHHFSTAVDTILYQHFVCCVNTTIDACQHPFRPPRYPQPILISGCASQWVGIGQFSGRSWGVGTGGGYGSFYTVSTLRQHCVNTVSTPVLAQVLTRVNTCFGPGVDTH